MRSLRLSLYPGYLRHRNVLFSTSKVPASQSGPPSYTSENIEQTSTPSLLGMLWDHHLHPESRRILFKESYNRVPDLHHTDILKMLKLFLSLSVPSQVCLKLAQVFVMRANISQPHYLEFLQILFRNTEIIYPFGNVIKLTLGKINREQISNDFLHEMWVKSIDRYSSNQLYPIIWTLTTLLMKRLRGLRDEQIFDVLVLSRSTKHSSLDLVKTIHTEVIKHRPNNLDLMGLVLASCLTKLHFNTQINEAYSQKLIKCLESGEVPPNAIGLAGALAKLNYIKPGLYRDLEPYATKHLENGALKEYEVNGYLSGSAIADYFPKKFIQAFAVPDRLRSLMRQLTNRPFLKPGMDICTIINYAKSKGVDLELSHEVQTVMEEFTVLFSKLTWQFQSSDVNPWESRASSSLASIFPLYVNWPTCNGYIIDACLFFDREGNPMKLSNELDFLVHSNKNFYGYFDRFGLDNTRVRSDTVDFQQILNVMRSPDILDGVHTKFAIEFNGPHHFLKADDDEYLRMDGQSMLRRKFLLANGWEYIGVPFTLFEKIKNKTKFQTNIRDLINHVLSFKQ